MKFDYGHWRLLPGTQALYAASVVDVQVEKDALVVTGYDRPVHSRWDLLNGAIITARFSSPMPNVLRVQLTHFQGQRPRLPVFDLDYWLTNPAASIGRDDRQAWLESGDLRVEVPVEGEWRLTFTRSGKPLTESAPKAVGLFAQDGKTYLRERLRPGRTLRRLREERPGD
jgi:alpha-D-xyloside xylohydrolase